MVGASVCVCVCVCVIFRGLTHGVFAVSWVLRSVPVVGASFICVCMCVKYVRFEGRQNAKFQQAHEISLSAGC